MELIEWQVDDDQPGVPLFTLKVATDDVSAWLAVWNFGHLEMEVLEQCQAGRVISVAVRARNLQEAIDYLDSRLEMASGIARLSHPASALLFA
jgi:hypothetical protein